MAFKRKAECTPEEWAVISAKKAEYDKKWKESNPSVKERQSANSKKWRLANLERVRENKRKYVEANREKVRAQNREQQRKESAKEKRRIANMTPEQVEARRVARALYRETNAAYIAKREKRRIANMTPEQIERRRIQEKANTDANRDKINERAREKRRANPEEARRVRHEKYIKNKEKVAEQGKRWREANKERVRELNRRLKQTPEVKAKNRAYQAARYHADLESSREYARENAALQTLRKNRRKAQMHLQQVLQYGTGLE